MPSPARTDINTNVLPSFRELILPGSRILSVGVDIRWDSFYKEFWQKYIYETIDINPERNATYTGDIELCPQIQDIWYDAIIFIGVYEYVKSFENAKAEIFRILKPNGYVLFSVPGEAYSKNPPYDKRYLPIEKLKTEFKPFEIISTKVTFYKSSIPYYSHSICKKGVLNAEDI